MSDRIDRHVSARRRWTSLVCTIAFTGFLVFALLLLLVEMVVEDPRESAVGRAFELVTGGSAIAAFVVGTLTTAFGELASPSRGYWSPRDRPLPVWGRAARIVARIAIRGFWISIVVVLATVVPALIQRYAHVGPDIWDGAIVERVLVPLTQLAVLVTVLSGMVWLVAEMASGFRERREMSAASGRR